MQSAPLINGFDKKRLRLLLALLFLALALPTAMLTWQAYGQLKWEAFHQYRGDAEELTRRIDKRLTDRILAADAHSFADYAFLVLSGDPSANFLQRSPLSAYPVTQDLPGVLGYFQVDTDGRFSTPLLPSVAADAAKFGIGSAEYRDRIALAREIHSILADNRLVQSRPSAGAWADVPASVPEGAFEPEVGETAPAENDRAARTRPASESPRPGSGADSAMVRDDAKTARGLRRSSGAEKADREAVDEVEAKPREQDSQSSENYTQAVFDRLNQPMRETQAMSGAAEISQLDDFAEGALQSNERQAPAGKVSQLKLDPGLQKKSEEAEREESREQPRNFETADSPGRSKRTEKIMLPEALQSDDGVSTASAPGPAEIRVSTFESEIDPFEFSLLDSGHFVLFRKVWRDGERYIQGFLIDRPSFIQDVFGARFMDTALSGMSNLIIAYQDDLIQTFSAREVLGYPDVSEGLGGALLYRNRLSAPFESLELIFSINRLPPGPGAGVLMWVTLVLAVVFVGGFVVLYRLGASQIDLARQQQDFVSAVSHELKTPLTSIRMYGEMLKEGWADEGKRQSYYEFIHDESERLSRLIANVLQLASISGNEPQFNMKRTSVGSLMSNVESKISSQVDRAGFELRISRDADTDDAKIDIDEDCFAQIIINLVDNAIKFSKSAENKVIELGCKRAAHHRVLFWVRDFGPGIPADHLKKIFRLFYRSESELTRETVGTGIGLAIVSQLTQAMNGSVDVLNVEPGAEFRIRFPAITTDPVT